MFPQYLKKTLSLLIGLNIAASPVALGADLEDQLSAQDSERLMALMDAEIAAVRQEPKKKIVAEFEALAATIYNPANKPLFAIDEESSVERKEAVADLMFRYNAVRAVVADIPGAKEKVYVKLFGDRENSPYYGAVSQDEFKDEGYLIAYGLTGAPIFLILYALSNMGDD